MRRIHVGPPKLGSWRFIICVLSCVTLFFLMGCGGSSVTSQPPPTGPPPTQPPPTEPPPPPDPTIVTTQSGQVQGIIQGNLIAFRDIPYAAPPTGSLRWKPPAPPAAWQGIRSAASFGNKCPQLDTNNNPIGDEDCLTLNVYVSDPPPTVKQPVMFFIPGGANVAGDPQEAPLDLSPLAANGVVVVTVQYRLGLLGFLAHPLLTAEGGGSSGNYGLRDQIAALTWVQNNISAFGGDPTRVMAFGESAGAIDLQPLLVSPMAKGLFTRAGMESGAVETGAVYSLADSAAFYETFIQPLGCDTAADVLACLRAVPVDMLLTALHFPPVATATAGPLTPVLTMEPDVIPVDPFVALQQNGSPVPLLIGSNATEMTVFINDLTASLDQSGYVASLHTLFDPVGPNVADQVLALNPSSDYANPSTAMAYVRSDYYIGCAERNIALAAAGTQRPAVWRYFFTHTLETPGSTLDTLGAFHSEEIPFVFNNFQDILGVAYTPSAAELQLSSEMMGYWTRFAAAGDPNGAGAVQWLRYDNQNESVLQLDDTTVTINAYHKDQCNYLSTLPLSPQ
jgi:para-nitrobenzyl esterase